MIFYIDRIDLIAKMQFMKIKTLFFVLVLFLTISANAQTINWLKDFKEASRLARETGKPLLLDFTASWCKPCLEMDKSFWTRPDVIELANQFVAVKLNFDSEKGLARKYYVSAIPNVVAADPWENGLTFSRGFGSNSDLILARMKVVPKDFSPVKEAFEQLETDKKDIEALTKIAGFYNDRKFYYQSNEYAKQILKLETDVAKRETLMINIGFNYLRAGEPDEADDYFKDFRKEFPQSKNNEAAIFGLGFASVQKKKIKSAEKILAELKTAYPESGYIAQLEKEIAGAKASGK